MCFSNRFSKNSAYQDGGAVYFAIANYGASVLNTIFDENDASENGGALFFASSNGNGLYNSLQSNSITLNGNFMNGYAQNGAAVYLFFQNRVVINSPYFYFNIALINGTVNKSFCKTILTNLFDSLILQCLRIPL